MIDGQLPVVEQGGSPKPSVEKDASLLLLAPSHQTVINLDIPPTNDL